jgi:hypothetical protein
MNYGFEIWIKMSGNPFQTYTIASERCGKACGYLSDNQDNIIPFVVDGVKYAAFVFYKGGQWYAKYYKLFYLFDEIRMSSPQDLKIVYEK